MQFYDEVKVIVRSWRGGDGSSAGRREKYVAYGWPAGGDGWEGGSVFLEANHNEYTLMPYRVNATYKAWNWEHGKWKDKYGHAWEDKVLYVPVGTVVRDTKTWDHIMTLWVHGERKLIMKWWIGWLGNMHFVNPKKQRSQIALLGEPALQRDVTFELQLLADVGLVWAPSVGKSSFINAISNVKAQVAEYHFTTLVPNLWVIEYKNASFTMIDIPGLIEWASSWKWLGNEFLRHVLKSSLLALTIDVTRYEAWIDEALGLMREWEGYLTQQYGEWETNRSFEDNELIQSYQGPEKSVSKKWYFLFSKSDLLIDEEIRSELSDLLYEKFTAMSGFKLTRDQYDLVSSFASSATREHVDLFLEYCSYHLDPVTVVSEYDEKIEEPDIKKPTCVRLWAQEYANLIEEWYIEDKGKKREWIRSINHPQVSFMTYVLPWWNDEAELRYRQRLEELRILQRMKEKWVKKWDILLVGNDYHGYDARRIKWE